jgi:hypothetical protein
MLTINKNQKKLKCFYKEGTYKGKTYDAKCNLLGPIGFSVKYEFDKGYLLVTLDDGGEEKYYVNGTALAGSSLIENWCINKNTLRRLFQNKDKFNSILTIIEKKANDVYKLVYYRYNKNKNKYILQGYSTFKRVD